MRHSMYGKTELHVRAALDVWRVLPRFLFLNFHACFCFNVSLRLSVLKSGKFSEILGVLEVYRGGCPQELKNNRGGTGVENH